MFASNDAVARADPEGDHATARTDLVCPVGMDVWSEKIGEGSAV
jgi:hypothetical protein